MHGLGKMGFEILTNTTWANFHSDISSRLHSSLDVPPAQLAYRLHYDGVYSNYSPLSLDLDWSIAMMKVCRRKQDGFQVEINVLKLKTRVRKSIIDDFDTTNTGILDSAGL